MVPSIHSISVTSWYPSILLWYGSVSYVRHALLLHSSLLGHMAPSPHSPKPYVGPQPHSPNLAQFLYLELLVYKLHRFFAGMVFPLSTITKPPLNLIQYGHASPLIPLAHWSDKSGQAQATWDTVTTPSLTIFFHITKHTCVQTSSPPNFADLPGWISMQSTNQSRRRRI